ncbi:MAG: peroxiredoxin family protein [Candidatus Hodarchaeota archaeon]
MLYIIILLSLFLINQPLHSCSEKKQFFSYGDKAPDFCELDTRGNTLLLSEQRGIYTLIIFFNPVYTFSKFNSIYAEVLYNKYKNKDFNVIGVSNSDIKTAQEFSSKCNLTFPIIADESKKIHSLYKIKDCCGTVLVNKIGKIEFYDKISLNEEEMRQLVESKVLNKIRYNFEKPKEQEIFKLGNFVPSIILFDTSKQKIFEIEEILNETLILTIFCSFCSPCKTGRRIKTLIELEKKTMEKNIKGKIKVAFTEPFSDKDIDELQKYTSIPFQTYIIPRFWLLTEDQRYITDDSLKNDPLTLVINTHKKVVFVEKIGMNEEDILYDIENIMSKNEK